VNKNTKIHVGIMHERIGILILCWQTHH